MLDTKEVSENNKKNRYIRNVIFFFLLLKFSSYKSKYCDERQIFEKKSVNLENKR